MQSKILNRKRISLFLTLLVFITFLAALKNEYVQAGTEGHVIYDESAETLNTQVELTQVELTDDISSIKSYNDNTKNVVIKDVECSGGSPSESVPVESSDVSKGTNMEWMFDERRLSKVIEVQNWSDEEVEILKQNNYIPYTITYKSGDSKIKDDDKVAALSEDEALNYVKDKKIPGYRFEGYNSEGGFLNCEYVKLYRVIFKNEDGSILKEQEVLDNTEIEFPESPSKEDDGEFAYTFVKWIQSINDETGDIEYIAYFEKNLLKEDLIVPEKKYEDVITESNGQAEEPEEVITEPEYQVTDLNEQVQSEVSPSNPSVNISNDEITSTNDDSDSNGVNKVVKVCAEAPENPDKKGNLRYLYFYRMG